MSSLWMPPSTPLRSFLHPPAPPHKHCIPPWHRCSPRHCRTRAPPASVPPYCEPPEGSGTLWTAALPQGSPTPPQHSPSCHVDDTSLVRTTSRTGAASCTMPEGLGGRGLASPSAALDPRAARMERGWKQGDGPPTVALSPHGRLTLLLAPSKPTFPCCCPSQTFKSRESGPKTMRLSKIINPRITRFPLHLLLLRGFKRLSAFFFFFASRRAKSLF